MVDYLFSSLTHPLTVLSSTSSGNAPSPTPHRGTPGCRTLAVLLDEAVALPEGCSSEGLAISSACVWREEVSGEEPFDPTLR